MNFNKDRVYRSTPDKWGFESTSKPHCFWKSTPVVNHSTFKIDRGGWVGGVLEFVFCFVLKLYFTIPVLGVDGV